jgi:hypothetical protein
VPEPGTKSIIRVNSASRISIDRIVLAIGAFISAAVLPAVVASSSRVPAVDPFRGALKLVEERAGSSAAPLNKPNLI